MRTALHPLFAVLLAGCFAEFPAGVTDGGDSVRDGAIDVPQPPDPDDGVPPPDRGLLPPDDGLTDGPLMPDVDPELCNEISVAVPSVRLRAWDAPAPPAQATIGVDGMSCPASGTNDDADWLNVRVDGANSQLVLTTDTTGLATGRYEATIELKLGDVVKTTVRVTFDYFKTPPPDASRHVLVIGVGGLRGNAISGSITPALDWLLERAAYSSAAKIQAGSTASAAGWTSFFTGAGIDIHQVVGEDYSVRDLRHLSFMALAALRVRPRGGLVSMAYAIDALFEALHEPGDIDLRFAGDGALDDLGRVLQSEPVHLAFAHVNSVNIAGEAGGFALSNPDYQSAVEGLDTTVDRLMGSILVRPNIAQENWLIVLSTDRGGASGDPDVERIPLLVSGPTVKPETVRDASHLDVHTTVLDFLEIPAGAGSEGNIVGEHPREVDCDNNADDDEDGRTDCDDPDCSTAEPCRPEPEDCDNRVDDDLDGAVDCEDPDCDEDPRCDMAIDEICDNNADDDGDAQIDCNDDDCANDPACLPLACDAAEAGLGFATVEGEIDRDEQSWVDASCRLPNGAGLADRGGDDVYYFIAPEDGTYVFNTLGSQLDTVLSFWSPDCAGGELACADNSAQEADPGDGRNSRKAALGRVAMNQGEVVTVAVSGQLNDTGSYQLNVHPQRCEGPRIAYSLPAPGEDPAAEFYEANNTDRPTLFGGRCAGAANEVMWIWRVPQSGTWQIDTQETGFDTVLNILSRNCAGFVHCNDDAVFGGQNRLQSGVLERFEEGREYVIVVSGHDGATGDVRLRIQLR